MGSRDGLYLTRVLFEAAMSPEVLVIGPENLESLRDILLT